MALFPRRSLFAGWLLAGSTAVLLASAPQPAEAQPAEVQPAEGEPPVVVATFTILQDLAQGVLGEHGEVRVLSPVGAEVHDWDLTARNFVDLDEADLLVANGLGIEQWMRQVEAGLREEAVILPLAEAGNYETIAIRFGDYSGTPDPHLWLDPSLAAGYVATLGEELARLDPQRAEDYAANAEALTAEIEALDAELAETFARIPAERRVLISGEAAFHYFARAYDFQHDGIWGSNAEVEGGPEQMRRVLDLIEEMQAPALFWESTVSDRTLRAVAEDADLPVFGPIYADSLGPAEGPAGDYLGIMRENARLLVEALASSGDEASN